jgi:hypothetical protein
MKFYQFMGLVMLVMSVLWGRASWVLHQLGKSDRWEDRQMAEGVGRNSILISGFLLCLLWVVWATTVYYDI